MGNSADQISREITETRDDIEQRIVTLRQRSEVAVQRSKRALLVAAAVGAAVAVAVVGAVVVYRMTRPVTARERVLRIIPSGWWDRAGSLGEKWRTGFRRQVPPVRLYVGDKQVGEEPPSSGFQKIALRVAQAAGTAVGGAVVQRMMSRFDSKDKAS